MKFIREIIGEKRQMEEANTAASAAPHLESRPTSQQPVQDAVVESENLSVHTDTEEDIHDELAAFVAAELERMEAAKRNAPDAPDALQDEPQRPAAQPERLMPDVADTPVATADQHFSDTTAPAADQDVLPKTSAFNAATAQQAEHPIENVFRDTDTEASDDAANAAAQDAPRPETAIPAPVAAKPQPEPAVQGQTPAVAQTPPAMPDTVEVPQPTVGRGASRHGRVKTRLLGFNPSMEKDVDPMGDNAPAAVAPYTQFPVGWLIVVEGEGRGSAFTLFSGVSNIGRGADQTICLDFGDNSISRAAHASIAFDPHQQSFFIGHSGKTNIVRRNDRPVLSTEEIASGDHITIGETTLRFVSLCGPDFSWENRPAATQAYAANG